MIEIVLAILGGGAFATLIQWLLFPRKNKAEAVGVEVANKGYENNNDRTEIENYKLIAQEWRESAQRWKDLADEYQTKLIENSRKFEAFLTTVKHNNEEMASNKKEIEKLRNLLGKANKRILELENILKSK